ncbi:MAG: hypothetical protein U0359_31100 [Byssovorax sp.]
MHRTLTLALAAVVSALAVACGGAQPPTGLPPGAADCKQPAAGTTTCEESCGWDATVNACLPKRGVIIENKPAPVSAPAPTSVTAPGSTTTRP